MKFACAGMFFAGGIRCDVDVDDDVGHCCKHERVGEGDGEEAEELGNCSVWWLAMMMMTEITSGV